MQGTASVSAVIGFLSPHAVRMVSDHLAAVHMMQAKNAAPDLSGVFDNLADQAKAVADQAKGATDSASGQACAHHHHHYHCHHHYHSSSACCTPFMWC